MEEMQFLFKNTAPGIPGNNQLLGDTTEQTTRSFRELDRAGRIRLCQRCPQLLCGRDTIRGMCEELGFVANPTKLQSFAP